MQFKVEIPEARWFIEKKPTNNIDAWNDYLQGRFYWSKITRQDMDSALLYFEQAKEKDPGFALAYAGIAHVWTGRQKMRYASFTSAGTRTLPRFGFPAPASLHSATQTPFIAGPLATSLHATNKRNMHNNFYL